MASARSFARGTEWAASTATRSVNSVPSTNEALSSSSKTTTGTLTPSVRDHYTIGDEYADEVMMGIDL